MPVSILFGVYQAFRWWGVGTNKGISYRATVSLSSVPVVGCRNASIWFVSVTTESIKRSGGGVSELGSRAYVGSVGVYQAFRWWGVGTITTTNRGAVTSLSSVPVVGCRNVWDVR